MELTPLDPEYWHPTGVAAVSPSPVYQDASMHADQQHAVLSPMQNSDHLRCYVNASYNPVRSQASTMMEDGVGKDEQMKQKIRDSLMKHHAHVDMSKIFRSYDYRKCGRISLQQFNDALIQLGLHLYVYDVEYLMDRFYDRSCDRMNYEGFCQFIQFSDREM